MTTAEKAETDRLALTPTELLTTNGPADKAPLLNTSSANLLLESSAAIVAHSTSINRLSELRAER